MIYVLFFSDAGAPATGLSPTIITYKKVSDGADVGSPPAITEVGGGFYKFTATPAEALVAVIDGSATLTNAFERYKVMQITTNDSALDAAITSRSTLTAQQVWEYATRTVSSFGTLVADMATAVWGAVARSLTDKAEFTISGTKQTLDDLNDLSQAEAQAAAAAALAAYDPPTRTEATADKGEIIAAIPDAVDLSALTALVTRAVGLAGENMVMDQTVYDADRKLTAARVRIYDSAAHALAAGETGLIATFPLTMTWAAKLLETMTQVIS